MLRGSDVLAPRTSAPQKHGPALLQELLTGKNKYFHIQSSVSLLSQNPRMVGVGRDLWGSPSPTPCPSRVTQSRLHRTLSRWDRTLFHPLLPVLETDSKSPRRVSPCDVGDGFARAPWPFRRTFSAELSQDGEI